MQEADDERYLDTDMSDRVLYIGLGSPLKFVKS